MRCRQWLCLVLAGWLSGWLGVAAQAAPATQGLLRPTEAEQVALSPSGLRIAYLHRGKQSDNDFVVLEQKGTELASIFVTRLSSNQSIKSYQWLSDDYLALSFAQADETLEQLAIADIAKNTISVLEPAAHVVQKQWGDAAHVLISTSLGCSAGDQMGDGRCLASVNLRDRGRNIVAPYVRLFPLGFEVVSPTEIYVHGYDPQRIEHAMQLNNATRRWEPIELQDMNAVLAAQRRATAALAGQIPQGSMPVMAGGKPAIGYLSAAPKRAFTSLSADFDELEVALETGFSGHRAALVQVSDDLSHGLVRVGDYDMTARYLLWDRAKGLMSLAMLQPKIDEAQLATTTNEASWVSGLNIAVTRPPQGMPVRAVVIQPTPAAEVNEGMELPNYDGEAQVMALQGAMHVRVLIGMPNRIGSGAAAQAWRAQVHQRIQQVIDAARVQAGPDARVCLLANIYLGSLLLTGDSFEHVDCMVALNAPLLPQQLSQRIQLSQNAFMKLAPAVLERQVRGVFALSDGSLVDPAKQTAQLPARVFLGYAMTEPLHAVFARESGDFRSSAKHAGKEVTYWAELSNKEDESAYWARMVDAVAKFVTAGGGTAVASKL